MRVAKSRTSINCELSSLTTSGRTGVSWMQQPTSMPKTSHESSRQVMVPFEERSFTSSSVSGIGSSYHRGQVVTLLRQLEHTPLGSEFLIFLLEGRKR